MKEGFGDHPLEKIIHWGMNRMPIIIDIDGSEVQIYEKMYDYVCNANFSHYADEVVDASAYRNMMQNQCFQKCWSGKSTYMRM